MNFEKKGYSPPLPAPSNPPKSMMAGGAGYKKFIDQKNSLLDRYHRYCEAEKMECATPMPFKMWLKEFGND